MQSLWLIIIVFFLVLLILPVFVKAYVSFDFLHNLGVLSLYIFFIKILTYKIKYEKGDIVVYTNKNKKEIEVKVSNKQLRFLKQLSVQLKQKIILKKINIFSRIGLNDASSTALCIGLFNILASIIVGYIKFSKKSAKMIINSNPNYNGSNFTISIVASCFITLFDIIYSLIMSFVIIKRSEKYERV